MKKTLTSLLNYQKFLKQIIGAAKKVLWFLARDAFLFTLILVLLAIVFGEFLFYNYVLLVDIKALDVSSQISKFEEESYQSMVQELESRESISNNPLYTQYQDPFY